MSGRPVFFGFREKVFLQASVSDTSGRPSPSAPSPLSRCSTSFATLPPARGSTTHHQILVSGGEKCQHKARGERVNAAETIRTRRLSQRAEVISPPSTSTSTPSFLIFLIGTISLPGSAGTLSRGVRKQRPVPSLLHRKVKSSSPQQQGTQKTSQSSVKRSFVQTYFFSS
jgi:hypothetical protein